MSSKELERYAAAAKDAIDKAYACKGVGIQETKDALVDIRDHLNTCIDALAVPDR